MAVVKRKPTSPGRRFVVSVSNPELHKGRPYASLTESKKKSGGRNSSGRITVRHIGGGHKKLYRIVDFKRDKDNVPAKVERIEYDPNSCLLYTSPSPRDRSSSRMPSSA